MTAIEAPRAAFGELLRGWRQHRRLSQLELSTRAAASTRHLSFLENGNAELAGDPVLADLANEVAEYPGVAEVLASGPALPSVDARRRVRPPEGQPSTWGGALLPLRLATPRGELSFFSTIATFGTPNDITLDELSIEMFFPADPATSASLGERSTWHRA